MKRIEEKKKEVEKFLAELGDILPDFLEEYKSNLEKKAACERYAEKIIEALVDLAFLVIKSKKFKLPADDLDAFKILMENKVIDQTLTKKLQNAKGMRNIIVHCYGEISDKLVFQALTEELERDARDFLKKIS